MYLASIDIINFRSFKSLHVDLLEGLNVLVGRNNAGKSNLVDAIRYALGPAASRGESLWLERDDFFRSSAAASPETLMSVTLMFCGLSEAQRAHFFEIIDFDLADISKSKAIVRFEASWPKDKRQAAIKRTGGPITSEPPEVPSRILESLPVTFLPALRDAEAALVPGHRSRLAALLRDLAERQGDDVKKQVVTIFEKASGDLLGLSFIKDTAVSLCKRTSVIAGTDDAPSTISASDVQFEKILRTLQLRMSDSPIGALSANGLGFNNLLYMAVVLEHLKHETPNECPLLLVEEPEAHLHPQLTSILAEYLANTTPGRRAPQTLVTTHSPTLTASVPPDRLHVLFADASTKLPRCNGLSKAGMTGPELNQLQRMMDVTRATLYFAKGAILVEGVCEALLVPVLAERLGYNLSREHISVVPICGVAFETFKKVLVETVLGIPIAMVSDADPPVKRGKTWESDEPEQVNGAFVRCDRLVKLLDLFKTHPTVLVSPSDVTLEYDLALAGDGNAKTIAQAWENCFIARPRTFNTDAVTKPGQSRIEKAMATWRGICRADPSATKAELAHQLASLLASKTTDGKYSVELFEVPPYIRRAIEHVVGKLRATPPTTGDAT